MKLALAQTPPTNADIEAAFARIDQSLEQCRLASVDMLVLPELYLPGYNQPEQHQAMAQDRDEGWLSALAERARKSSCAITFGWAERCGGTVFNTATTLDKTGEPLAHYRKLQLFGEMERQSFKPGTAPPPVFRFMGRQIGLLICYDIEFPEHSRALATCGAEVILVPTANPEGYDVVQNLLVPARAYENRLTIAYANYCGAESGLRFGGQSLIAGPDGAALAKAGQAETLLIVDVPSLDRYPQDQLSTQLRDIRRGEKTPDA
ncbi:MAG: carbon-nitrogen hydrolase family protein [Pseudomonadota bacterium]